MLKDNNKAIAARNIVGGCLIAGAAFGQLANADEFHYNNILIGDRAAGMGGAYTAISDDPSGLYYNPAGITFASGRNLSASVNAYQQTNTEYKNVLGGNGWHRRSNALLPNFFGVTQPLGKGVIGLSWAVPDSILEDQDQTFYNIPSSLPGITINRYVINFNHKDVNYQFGPSYAYQVSKGFSIGGTVYGYYRERESILNQLIFLSDGRYQWTNSYYETSETGMKPIFGVMMSPTDKLAIGMSVSKVFVFDSSTRNQQTLRDINDGNNISWSASETDEKREHPVNANLGVAFFASDAFLISWDLNYYGAAEDNLEGKKEAVLNTSLGAEYYVTDHWALRAGLYTNYANSPDLEAGKSGQAEHIDLYGGTLSLSHFSGNSSTTIGVGYSQGSGKAQLFGAPSTAIQDVERNTLMAFISASSSF